MRPAAIGIRAHSGWGAVVAAAGAPGAVELICRRRAVIVQPETAGTKQPYHFAKELELAVAERYLADCAVASERLASEALGEVVQDALQRGYVVRRCAILLAEGRALPALPNILASHALIHTAEGEFFRRAFWNAAAKLNLQVTGVRERELSRAAPLWRDIEALGRAIGPPWTADQKNATLAALCTLATDSCT